MKQAKGKWCEGSFIKLSVVVTAVILMSSCGTVEAESWQNYSIDDALLSDAVGNVSNKQH